MLNFVLESFEQSTPQLLPSMKLTWHPKIGHPERKLVFQPSIFRCYVSFREGKVPSFFQVQIDQDPPLDRCHGGRFRHRKPLFLWRYNFGRHWLLLFASTRGPLAFFKTNTCDKRQKLKREPDIKQHQKSLDSLFNTDLSLHYVKSFYLSPGLCYPWFTHLSTPFNFSHCSLLFIDLSIYSTIYRGTYLSLYVCI